MSRDSKNHQAKAHFIGPKEQLERLRATAPQFHLVANPNKAEACILANKDEFREKLREWGGRFKHWYHLVQDGGRLSLKQLDPTQVTTSS